jgi:predicted RNA-binding protein with PIN domain
MDLLIDTWNVVQQTGVLPADSAGIGTAGLCKMIENSRWSGKRVTLVCDGTPSDEAINGSKYQTIFTGPFKSADAEIIDRVANSSAPRSILVITSDREIISSIRKRGAHQLSSSAFLHALVEDSHVPKTKTIPRPSGLSPKLAQEWREHFGIDSEVMETLQNTPIPKFQHNNQLKKEKTKPIQTPKQKEKRSIKLDEPALPANVLEEARRLLEDR